MRLSTSLVPTLREEPAETEALSHKLMLRAGLVRQLAAGIFVYLPLGQRVLDKINAIIREEMNAIGGQEIAMPVLHPAEIWKQSGRWEGIPEMFKLRDRYGRDLCLGMTHEEVVAWLAAREIRSYRDLPQIWYQIQTKERDEARPRSGVLRTREFLMKDAYTLDPDAAALDVSYNAHKQAYCKIFDRCGIRYVVVDSDPGMMGGSGSHEFMAPSAAGEDDVALCAACGYAANVELARGVPTPGGLREAGAREVATPEARTIAEVAAQLKVDASSTVKSLVFMVGDVPVLALVRGDHNLHERKLARTLRAEARPAQPDEVRKHLGVSVGSVGLGAGAVEQRHDADGIIWPWAIAPFHVHIVPVAVKDATQMAAATEIEKLLEGAGFDVLMDDRDERAGVKFKDADLLGVPIRVTVGNAFIKEGVVEVRDRATRVDQRVPKSRVVEAARVIEAVQAMG